MSGFDSSAPPASGPQASRAPICAALRGVIDPEIERDIVSLGMVYGIEVADTTATVCFTLTSPGCPLASVLVRAVEAALRAVPEVDDVTVHLVWEPRWHPDMIEDERTP